MSHGFPPDVPVALVTDGLVGWGEVRGFRKSEINLVLGKGRLSAVTVIWSLASISEPMKSRGFRPR